MTQHSLMKSILTAKVLLVCMALALHQGWIKFGDLAVFAETTTDKTKGSESQDAEKKAGDVAKPDCWPHAEDVEQPDDDNRCSPDYDWPTKTEADRVGCLLAGGPSCIREPLGNDQRAYDQAVDRQNHRPTHPVTKGNDWSNEVGVLAERLVGVDRKTARFLWEHRREFGINVVLQRAEQDRDRPEDDRARCTEDAD